MEAAGLVLVEGPFTEVHQVNRYQLVDQLQHVRCEVFSACAGNQFPQLEIKMRTFHISNTAGQTHSHLILDVENRRRLPPSVCRPPVLLEPGSVLEASFSHGDLSYVCSGNEGHNLP